MNTDIMVDLETLASSGDAAIISIGAVAFNRNTGEMGPEFKVNVTGKSSQAAGLRVDAETVEWWFGQSQEARDHLKDPPPIALASALGQFTTFIVENAEKGCYIWGNGATFDNVILHNAYKATGSRAPWSYTKDACYRTMKNMVTQVPREQFRYGTAHDSLDDAIGQAQHLCAIFAYLRNTEAVAASLVSAPL